MCVYSANPLIFAARACVSARRCDNLQNASGAEASEELSLLVLLAILAEVKSISKQVHHRAGQGKQVPFRAPHAAQRLQRWRFSHPRSLYLHWYNIRGSIVMIGTP